MFVRKWLANVNITCNVVRLLASTASPLKTTTQSKTTLIQALAPRTAAAKSWIYEGWPVTAIQGDASSVLFPLLNFQRMQIGSVELQGDIFNIPVRRDIIHRVVRWQRAKKQQGTHKSKTRAEVRGGGKKPWKQKGTGRARHGSIRSPLWRGGGKAHGPIPRSHAHSLNRKVRQLGLKCALSAKAVENRLMIVDSIKTTALKTKVFHKQLTRFLTGAPRLSVLILDSGKLGEDGGKNLRLVSRNIPDVDVLPVEGANVYDILRRDILVLTDLALQGLTKTLQTSVKR